MKSVSVGSNHTCAVLDNSTVKCLGTNTYSVVTIGSSTILTPATSGSQCHITTFETTSANGRCLLAAGSQKFLWIEGKYMGATANSAAYILGLAGTKFSTIRRASFGPGVVTHSLTLKNGAKNNRFEQVRIANANTNGIQMHGNTADNKGNNPYENNDYNIFTNVVSTYADFAGVYIRPSQWGTDGGSKLNLFSRMTIAKSDEGIHIWDDSAALTDHPFHNVVVSNSSMSGGAGVMIDGTLSAGGEDTKFTGNFLVGTNAVDCDNNGGTRPAIDDSCDPADSSDHNKVTGVSVSTSFVGLAVVESTNTSENGSGQVGGSSITDINWFNFDHFYRSWSGATGGTYPCMKSSGSNCNLSDGALAAAVSVIRNTSGNGSTANDAFTAGAACPTQADGGDYVESQWFTYDASFFAGMNSFEVSGDSIGDDDGFCESNEACLYTPNFGAHQGHGTLSTCSFANGTITGVTMYGYGTNGY